MLRIHPIGDTPARALKAALCEAPYLARLTKRHPQIIEQLKTEAPDILFATLLDRLRTHDTFCDDASIMSVLRDTKQQAHLILAAADLATVWSVLKVTRAMTEFADAATQAAFQYAVKSSGYKANGLFLIALGKMGANELNYSSDIDIAAFYDPDVFDGGDRGPAVSSAKIIQHMTRLLETHTEDGYVLRTDLRLRPDPRSTPVCVSTRMAELYYESVGQNWERMVWIKARPFAGDIASANKFLESMKRFVWRHHLDYWAINDIRAIKAMINASIEDTEFSDPGPDLKLGPGGIREIEFFVQTQQLILGGRDPSLRPRDTLGAMLALLARGVIKSETAGKLGSSYELLRALEHRVQMRLDEQAHNLPNDNGTRLAIARLCGITDLDRFDKGVREVRQGVNRFYRELFDDMQPSAEQAGNLVFTGVDDDPGTVQTLQKYGFSEPPHIIEVIRQWHRGHISATRTPRGRECLTAILPSLLAEMAATGEPDTAFHHFRTFFEGLPSGVQVLSMLQVERTLCHDLVSTLALAPRLALTLGRKPALLEALLQPDLVISPIITDFSSFEDAMDAARLHVRDRAFIIGHDVLHGRIEARQVGAAYSDLADWTVQAMAKAAETECKRKFGPAPGDWCVAALGRLGGQAMTATSDLDIMVLYDPGPDTTAQTWFTRFTQRLITALSAQTAEGALYEVDMRLRPSGRSGPVAVRISAFEAYHLEQAWTWEHMALTRFRPIAEQNGLGQRLQTCVADILSRPRDAGKLREDVLDMRRRLHREKPGQGLWDLKLGEGGLVDIEFIIQHGLLGLASRDAACPRLESAIHILNAQERLTQKEASILIDADEFLSSLLQIQRLALAGDILPDDLSSGLKDRLQRAVGLSDFTALTDRLIDLKAQVTDLRRVRIGPLAP